MRAYHWTRPNLDLSTGIKINVRHMCSARSGNGPTRVNTIDKQLKNESVKKEDTEFCGENLIVRPELKNCLFVLYLPSILILGR